MFYFGERHFAVFLYIEDWNKKNERGLPNYYSVLPKGHLNDLML